MGAIKRFADRSDYRLFASGCTGDCLVDPVAGNLLAMLLEVPDCATGDLLSQHRYFRYHFKMDIFGT